MKISLRFVALACQAFALAHGPLNAQVQRGTIAGQVLDVETGRPLSGAAVEVVGQTGLFETSASGRFAVDAPAGSHSVVVALIGYETTRVDGVRVTAGATTEIEIAVRSRALVLNPVVVTVSRRQEKALDAPASVSTVSSSEIARVAATSAADHVRTLPGIDAVRTGINQSSVVARGFNNVFSGSLLTIIDNRYARVPSLRFNAYNMFPTTDLDIERIEVSLGPGAALYGPNASNGVMHIITSSPIDRPGTTISLAGGERSVVHGQLRTALAPSQSFGMQLSGQYFRGTDWTYDDPLEITPRSYDTRRYSVNARVDYRFGDDGEVILNGGSSAIERGIEMTGIGAAQVQGWAYHFGQARVSRGRFFAQGFMNLTSAGDQTFMLRTEDAIVDRSRTMAAQFQHGLDLGSWQSFTYGVDWQRTDPRTDGTVFGRNENDDMISEVGAYLHSETALGEKLELVTAIRVDDHDRLTSLNFAPRAALVVKPNPEQNIRLTFNRAFATPTTTNLFLDIVAASIPGTPFQVRARGVPPAGFTFEARCQGGLMSRCMRTPFLPGQSMPANAALLWDGLVDLLVSVEPSLALLAPWLKSPGANPGDPELGTVFRRLDLLAAETGGDPFPLDNTAPETYHALESTINNTIEFGYKGLLGDRVLLAVDVYRSRIENFVGPLQVATPNVFLDPASTQAFVLHRLDPALRAGLLTKEAAAQIVATIASVPLGTIVPDQVESPDLLISYRNFGQVDFWGADLAAQVVLSDRFRLNGSYSFQSDECFDLNGDGSCRSADDVALNAPNHKGSLGLTYDDPVRGMSMQTRVRASAGFPMSSGVYVGDVDGYYVVDATLGYQVPFQPRARLSLTANNLLNNMHREFVGAPEIGRLVLVRLQYDL